MTSPQSPPAPSEPSKFLTDLFKIAVETADPMRVVRAHLPDRPKGRLLVVGAGKACARMPAANTNAATLMIGEKAADLMLGQ